VIELLCVADDALVAALNVGLAVVLFAVAAMLGAVAWRVLTS